MNVPARGNTIALEPPASRPPVSNEPSSAVAVCVAGSAFVQVTESPTFTVMDGGWNWKLLIVTDALAASTAPAVATEIAMAAIAHATRRVARAATVR